MNLIDLETERCGKIIRLHRKNKSIAVDFGGGDVTFIAFLKLRSGYLNGRYMMVNNSNVYTRRTTQR